MYILAASIASSGVMEEPALYTELKGPQTRSTDAQVQLVRYQDLLGQAKVLPTNVSEDVTNVIKECESLVNNLPVIEVSAAELEEDVEGSLEKTRKTESPHREFHTAVIRALNINSNLVLSSAGISTESPCAAGISILVDYTCGNLV